MPVAFQRRIGPPATMPWWQLLAASSSHPWLGRRTSSSHILATTPRQELPNYLPCVDAWMDTVPRFHSMYSKSGNACLPYTGATPPPLNPLVRFPHVAAAAMWIFSGAGRARPGEGRKKKPPPPAQDWDAHGLAASGTPVPVAGLDGGKRYKVSELGFLDRRRRAAAAETRPPVAAAAAALRPGGVYTRAQLLERLQAMADGGRLARIDLHATPRHDGTLGVTVSFADEHAMPAVDGFRCVTAVGGGGSRPCILPEPVREEVVAMTRRKKQGRLTAGLRRAIGDVVEGWYHGEGFACARVVGCGRLAGSGEVVCEVAEGEITGVEYQFEDKLGNVVQGSTRIPLIERLRPGQIYNTGAEKQALKCISSLGLFSDIQVNPRADEMKEGGVVVQIKLKELEPMSADLTTEWSTAPGRQRRPIRACIRPGGTLSVKNCNMSGLNRSLVGSVTFSNMLKPQDDLSFNLEYAHPYLDGVEDRSRNRTFKTSFFNTRKLSPGFGPNMDGAPPFWNDRVGFKANITENFTRQSKFTYGLVVEETRTHNGTNCTHSSSALPSSASSIDGSAKAFSGPAVNRTAFLQANITRDNKEFVNGATIGDRYIFQVDQGLGIGSNRPFFNRHQLSMTKFVNLNNQEQDVDKPPPAVLALHGRYAGCVGDLPHYEAFALGEPRSVRGYGMGTPGASMNLLEVAAELRVPITVMNTHTQVYAFAGHGMDIGSYMELNGKPAELFRRAGHASSYGVGVKLGPVRAEYAIDHSDGTGAFSLRLGDRF
ncbi:hypothetical protein ACP4OV_015179 [Aristida adscensionis]